MAPQVTILDYGLGNIHSIANALRACDALPTLSADPEAVAKADRLILPGVGAFPAGMKGLQERGLVEPLKQAAREGKPLIGICLGMQLLFESSDEMGKTAGLGLLPGRVTRIAGNGLKVPHMGWNQLDVVRDHLLVSDLIPGSYAYFVHSYAIYPEDQTIVLATTDYGGPFASIVGRSNVCGLQFHPEKSQAVGLKLLRNFLNL